MECSCVLKFSFSSAQKAKEANVALGIEGPKNGRSKTISHVVGNKLVVKITSTDSVSLRAAANGCLRNMKIIENVERSSTEETESGTKFTRCDRRSHRGL